MSKLESVCQVLSRRICQESGHYLLIILLFFSII
nr:MAG TPA: hypothetical protein [Caudoviricetes sp.]